MAIFVYRRKLPLVMVLMLLTLSGCKKAREAKQRVANLQESIKNRNARGPRPFILSENALSTYPYVVDLGLVVPDKTIVLFKIDETYGVIIPQSQGGVFGDAVQWKWQYDRRGLTSTKDYTIEGTFTAVERYTRNNPFRRQNKFTWDMPMDRWQRPYTAGRSLGSASIVWYGLEEGLGLFCPNRRVLLCNTGLKDLGKIGNMANRKWHYYAGRERYDLATPELLKKMTPGAQKVRKQQRLYSL